MKDITIKKIEEIESYNDEGRFSYVAKSLGVSAWGMNLLHFPANWDGYPDHDHTEDGQEEVFFVLEGSAIMKLGDEEIDMQKDTFYRIGPKEKRKIIPGDNGVKILAIGGTPGQAYTSQF